MQVLNQSEHRILIRLEVALGHHGGTQNGNLAVTFKQFRLFGVDQQAIAPSLRALAALGIVEKTHQGSGGRTEYHDASSYRLTYRHTDVADPTDEWRRVKTLDEAKQIAASARKAKDPEAVERGIRHAKKDSSEGKKPKSPRGKNHLGNSSIPRGKNHRSSSGGESHPSIYISGRDTEQQAREARPSKGAVASGLAGHDGDTGGIRDDLIQSRIADRLGGGVTGWSILQAIPDDILADAIEAERSGVLSDDLVLGLRQKFYQRGAA